MLVSLNVRVVNALMPLRDVIVSMTAEIAQMSSTAVCISEPVASFMHVCY